MSEKPFWDDTWHHVRESYPDPDPATLLWCVVNGSGELVADTTASEPSARLISAAPDLVRALLQIEWITKGCESARDGILDVGEIVDAVLRKAGVR